MSCSPRWDGTGFWKAFGVALDSPRVWAKVRLVETERLVYRSTQVRLFSKQGNQGDEYCGG